jgi:hypothetical protein
MTVSAHPAVELLPRRSLRWLLAGLILWGFALPAQAQFMRLGPLDVDMSTSLEWVYSSNIDGIADNEESNLEKADHYIVWTWDLIADGPTTRSSELSFNTSLTVEKHFVRDDLDQVSDPFADVLLTHDTELGRLQLPTSLQYKRENTEDQDRTTRIYIPGQKASRIVQDTLAFTQGFLWQRDPFSWDFTYGYTQTRFDDEAFQEGDENDQTMDFNATWDVIQWGGQRRLDLSYGLSRQKTEIVNNPDAPGSNEWEEDQSIGLSLLILERPNFTYTLGYEKADDEDWRITHGFAIADQWELSPTTILDADASYKIDEEERDDTVTFVYSAGIQQELATTLNHSLRFTREPVNTFGSTSDTDNQSISYDITKTELFFANLTLNAGVTWELDKPQGPDAGEDEEIMTYTVTLDHSTALSRRLSRDFSYTYDHTESDLDDSTVIEHLVTIGFTFTF